MAKLAPLYNDAQFINSIAATGAKVFTYAAGSSTKQATYTDITGTTPQANPIILNSRGEPASPIWLTEGLSYKFVFAPSTDSDPPTSPIRTVDNVTGVNDASITLDQWVSSGITPTYVSATQFTLPGDQTSAFQVGRRVKATVTAGTVYGTISVSAFAVLTTVTLVMDAGQVLDSGLSSVGYGILTTTPNSIPYALSADKIQLQTYTAFTTGGTSSAFTLTPIPAIAANATNLEFTITLHTAPTGSPTLSVSGKAALNLKYVDSIPSLQFINSTVAPNGWTARVWNDGTNWVMKDIVPSSTTSKIQPITASVSANALTVTLNPTTLDFRSATISSGTVNTRVISSAITLVISNGSTLGSSNGAVGRYNILAIDNAGTVELAIINQDAGLTLDEFDVITTVAEGGAGAADSGTTIYSTTARAGVPYRVVGFIKVTEATAGVWATAPSTIAGSSILSVIGPALFNAQGGAPLFACRAWVNFNGTGTVAIRASGNVSSITDNGTGDYTINFTTAMPDANYSLSGMCLANTVTNDGPYLQIKNGTTPTTTAVNIMADNRATGDVDSTYVTVSIFR
ncbi:MAG: hypothetical protein V4440_14820 [Pseudomonadota bacterium]